MKFFILSLTLLSSLGHGDTTETVQIKPGSEVGASLPDLQKRLWLLERAVEQLQKRNEVEVAIQKAAPTPEPEPKGWTCEIEVRNKKYSATERTKVLATVTTLKKCSNYANFCSETQVKCSRQQ